MQGDRAERAAIGPAQEALTIDLLGFKGLFAAVVISDGGHAAVCKASTVNPQGLATGDELCLGKCHAMAVAFRHMSDVRDHGKRQIVWAAGILLGLGSLVSCFLLFGRSLPGLWGEWASTLIGVMTTPFLMEASFVLIGISIVAVINHLAAARSGDEWVDLESFENSKNDQSK